MKRLTKVVLKYIFPVAVIVSMFFTVEAKATSLWEFYSSHGKELPTISERAITAAEFGIFQYQGTAEQNNLLVKYLDEELRIANGELLGYSVVSKYRTTLRSSMTASQLTVPVSSIVTADGHTLTFADLGSVVYLTIEPGQSKEEIVKCTSIASSIWATCTRGLAFYGTSTAGVAANAKAHNAGSIVVMSNVHFTNEELVDKDTAETIQGVKTFGSFPEIVTSTALCTTDGQFCTKKYIDNVGAGGFTASNASTTRGLQVFGTSPETVGLKVTTTLKIDEGGYLSPIVSSSGGIQFGTDGASIDRSDDLTWTGTQIFGTASSSVFSVGTTLLVGATSTLSTTTINGLNVDGNAVRKIYIGTADVTATGTSETSFASTTIPGGFLKNNNSIHIKTFFDDMDGVGTHVLPLRLKYGTNTSTLNITTSAVLNNKGWYEAYITGTGTTTSQSVLQNILVGPDGITTTTWKYSTSDTMSVDSSTNQTLNITLTGGNAGNVFSTAITLVELIFAP